MNGIEYFRAETGHKKTYVVSPDKASAITEAKKYFKCKTDRIGVVTGWVVGNDLYLEDPHCNGKKIRFVAFYV